MIARKVWLVLALAFAGFVAGVFVSTGGATSVFKIFVLCPAAILMIFSPTDPRQSDIWMLVAPLNACLYACVGLTIWNLKRR